MSEWGGGGTFVSTAVVLVFPSSEEEVKCCASNHGGNICRHSSGGSQCVTCHTISVATEEEEGVQKVHGRIGRMKGPSVSIATKQCRSVCSSMLLSNV